MNSKASSVIHAIPASTKAQQARGVKGRAIKLRPGMRGGGPNSRI